MVAYDSARGLFNDEHKSWLDCTAMLLMSYPDTLRTDCGTIVSQASACKCLLINFDSSVVLQVPPCIKFLLGDCRSIAQFVHIVVEPTYIDTNCDHSDARKVPWNPAAKVRTHVHSLICNIFLLQNKFHQLQVTNSAEAKFATRAQVSLFLSTIQLLPWLDWLCLVEAKHGSSDNVHG